MARGTMFCAGTPQAASAFFTASARESESRIATEGSEGVAGAWASMLIMPPAVQKGFSASAAFGGRSTLPGAKLSRTGARGFGATGAAAGGAGGGAATLATAGTGRAGFAAAGGGAAW